MHRSSQDYYQLLGVSAEASQHQIKEAFKRKIIFCHPDKQPQPSELKKDQVRDILEAYRVLSNAAARSQYDLNRQSYMTKTAKMFARYCQSQQAYWNDQLQKTLIDCEQCLGSTQINEVDLLDMSRDSSRNGYFIPCSFCGLTLKVELF